MKKLKYLLFLLILIPFININALTLCDDTIVPDLPSAVTSDYIIVHESNGRFRLYALESGTLTSYKSGTSLKIGTSGDSATRSMRIYNTNSANTTWSSSSAGNNIYTEDLSVSTIYVVATTIDIYNNYVGSDSIFIEANYNVVCITEPVAPSDFSIINYIANIINEFVETLQENNISIHVTFISLLIFNFLIFVICYIITHFE